MDIFNYFSKAPSKSKKKPKKKTQKKSVTKNKTASKPRKQQAKLFFQNSNAQDVQQATPSASSAPPPTPSTVVPENDDAVVPVSMPSPPPANVSVPQKIHASSSDYLLQASPSPDTTTTTVPTAPMPEPTPSIRTHNPKEHRTRELSAYEIARLQNIHRNNEYMKTIGLGAAKAAAAGAANNKQAKTKKRRRPKPKARDHNAVPMPRRVSKRVRNMPATFDPSAASSSSSSSTTSHIEEELKEEELPFDDSKVCTYEAAPSTQEEDGNDEDRRPVVPPVHVLPVPTNTASSTSTTSTTSTTSRGQTSLTRLTEITNVFQDDALKKIYSMSFSPDCALLAAVGHNGRATVFGASGTSTGDVLMSFKAHKGWVASTMFLNSHMLLTAANDAVVTIWDLRKVLASGSNQRPRIVGTNSTLHNNGIFCADVKDGKLVTASKDKTVSYCTIGEQEGIVPIRWFETLHSGVIKNVSLRDVNVLASTGNDCDVCVCDARQTEKNGLVQRIEDVHVLSTNHVSWNPSNANVLLTASFGNTIKLWDLRKTGAGPVHGMKGHSMLYDGQRGDIYHPLFVGNGQYIVTPGTKSNALTIFDTTTGEIVSKGVTSVGGVTSLASCDVMGSRLAACKRGNVVLLDPVWS